MSDRLLTVAIPAYNRSAWLPIVLKHWLEQIKDVPDLVELLVIDDASTEPIGPILQECQKIYPFRYFRSPTNGGTERTALRLCEEARGKFIWITGNDDIPVAGAVKTALAALQKYPDISLFHLNYKMWSPPKVPLSTFNPDAAKDTLLRYPDEETHRVEAVAEFVEGDRWCFTYTGATIIKREYYMEAYRRSLPYERYSCMMAMLPHAAYIVENLLAEPAVHIGEPLLLQAINNWSWSSHQFQFYMIYMYDFYDLLEKNGIPPHIVDAHRAAAFADSMPLIKSYLQQRLRKNSTNFSLAGFSLVEYLWKRLSFAATLVHGRVGYLERAAHTRQDAARLKRSDNNAANQLAKARRLFVRRLPA